MKKCLGVVPSSAKTICGGCSVTIIDAPWPTTSVCLQPERGRKNGKSEPHRPTLRAEMRNDPCADVRLRHTRSPTGTTQKKISDVIKVSTGRASTRLFLGKDDYLDIETGATVL